MKKLNGRFKSPVNPHQILHQIPLQNPPIHQSSCNPPTNDRIHHINQAQTHYTEHELRLIDEVLYLHSLWHRGPPSHFGPTHNPNPFLRPSQTTHFKKPKKPHQISDKEWPIGPEHTCPPSNGPGWPAFPALKNPTTRPASDEERARVLGSKVQLKAVGSCVPLFRRRNGKNGGGGSGSESESDGESDDDDEEEMVDFIDEVFEENVELREFYVKNCQSAEFYCLICGVIGNKIGRKYKNCVALVQHSVSVSKTKKRKAHRAYGRVVCKVLGWDIDELPSVQSAIGDGVAGGGGGGLSSEKSTEAEDKSHTDVGTTTVVGVDGNAGIFNKTHVELKDVPDIVEKDEIACMDATCTPSEPKPEGGAKSQINEEHPAVEIGGNDVHLSQNRVEQNDSSGANEKDNVMDINANCAANELAHQELALMGNDAYEELPCLSGEFQIPE